MKKTMRRIKLIACDLDGTLLLNGAQELQPGTCDLIQALQDRGIRFFAASGRQYTNLRRLFEPIKDEIGYLCENGCLGFYEGKRLFKELLDRALGREIIEAILATEGAEVLLSGELVSYLQPKDPRYERFIRNVLRNDMVVVPDILNTPEDYMKVSLYEENGIRDQELWERRFGDRCAVVTGGFDWLDMTPLNVNKGTGLRQILSYLSISPEECMAIGDNDNDREMLKLAGVAVAMKSAKPEIRALADMETETVEALFKSLLTEGAN